MMPVYRYLDSNPHQSNQMPFPQHYIPNFEAAPSPMSADQSNSPMFYEPWPYGSNYGYSVPCHGCCNHGNYPGYYNFRSPCSHFAPAPPFHHCTNYPTFPGVYPIYYVPPPHYSKEQPRYEYDKEAPSNHPCCGCPNHQFDQMNDRSLRIEEQEPDAERKEGDSMVPAESRNYQYPVVWIPPDFLKKISNRMPFESEVKDWDKANHDTNSTKGVISSEREPRTWNGWFPLDIDGLKSLIQGESGQTQNQDSQDEVRKWSPIIWMPYKNQEEAQHQIDGKFTAPKHCDEAPTSFKVVPVNPPDGDGSGDKQPQENKEIPKQKRDAEIAEKTPKEKYIPVKQVQLPEGDNSEETQKRVKVVAVHHGEDATNGRTSGTGAKRQPSSPSIASKLPPVCLRVDPLRKKQSSNGSSRSLSPRKAQSETLKETTQDSAERGLKEDSVTDKRTQDSSLNKIKEVESNKKEIKKIQVVEGRSEESKGGKNEISLNKPVCSEEVSRKHGDEGKRQEGETIRHENARTEEEIEVKKVKDSMESTDVEGKEEKMKLSDVEAAVLIQSAYRGFEVRNWEPLKKLKQIAKVREQVLEVRNQIQALESSDLQQDDKQKMVIGEMIMCLLLKLDTIQGLHPSLRDIRRSLAKDLVTLQEKLDSLTSQQNRVLVKESSSSKFADSIDVDACKVVSSIEMQDKELVGVEASSAESSCENCDKEIEANQKNLTHVMGVASDSKADEATELVVDEEAKRKYESKIKESQGPGEKDCQAGGSLPVGEVEGKASDGNAQARAGPVYLPPVSELQSNSEEFIGPQDLNYDPKTENKPQMAGVDDVMLAYENSEENQLKMLPDVMVNEVPPASDLKEQTEKEKIEEEHGGRESDMSMNLSLPVEVENLMPVDKETEEERGAESNLLMSSSSPVKVENLMPTVEETDLLSELPIGVLDEETAPSEPEKCELLETGENKALPSGEKECNITADEASASVSPAASHLDSVDWMKVHEEIPGFSIHEEEERPHENVISNDDYISAISKPEEISSLVGDKKSDKVDVEEGEHGSINVDSSHSSESEAGSVATQEKEVVFEENKQGNLLHALASGVKEDVEECENGSTYSIPSTESEVGSIAADEKQVASEENKQENASQPVESRQEPECVSGNGKTSELSAKPAEEKEELGKILPELSTASHISNDEHDGVLDKKLIKENEKLKEMLEKLMEAGKEQLTVISDLTGRVKDLERKLPRKKKLRTQIQRRARPAASHAKIIDEPVSLPC